jgi:hypothetical protein
MEGEPDGAELGVAGHLRVQRLGPGLYAVSADVSVGSAPVLARRRLRLLVRRAASRDSSDVVPRLVPIARWSASDLN